MKFDMLVFDRGENHKSIDELAQTKKNVFFYTLACCSNAVIRIYKLLQKNIDEENDDSGESSGMPWDDADLSIV